MEIIRQHTDCRKNEETEQMVVDTVLLLHIFGHYIVGTVRTNDNGSYINDYRLSLDTFSISNAIQRFNALVENTEER